MDFYSKGASIRDTFDLTDQEVKILLILNVALAIPARVIIGSTLKHNSKQIYFSIHIVFSSTVIIKINTSIHLHS